MFRIKYEVFLAISAKVGLEILDNHQEIQVVITDQRMPDTTGVEFLQLLIEKHPNPIRIMLTGFANFADTVDAVNLGKIFGYLNKPWEEKSLGETLDKAVQKYNEDEAIRTKAKQTEEAERLANQMEFILRQELLS